MLLEMPSNHLLLIDEENANKNLTIEKLNEYNSNRKERRIKTMY